MTQIKLKIKKGDNVLVICGSDKGKTGTVERVIRTSGKLVVNGVNAVTRHLKPSEANPEGFVKKNLPIHISNVSLIDQKTGQRAKAGYKFMKDGTKVRVARKTGDVL